MQSLLAVLVIPTWVLLIMAIVLLVVLLWLGYARAPRIFGFGPHIVKTVETFEYTSDDEETGQPQKRSITTERQSARTVWEWLTILTISAVIAVVALMFTASQAQQQREIQYQQASDEALQAYFDQMSTLLLEDNLRHSEEDSGVRTLARARTLTVLERLDPRRIEAVAQFLVEADLVQSVEGREPIITLSGANLFGANLFGANLGPVNLSEANLSEANQSEVNLKG